MAFPAEILRSGVKLADSSTKGVQPTCQHYAWTGQDQYSKHTYASPVTRHCVVDFTRRQITNAAGQIIVIGATLTFVGDVPANGSAGRTEPFDTRDKIVLSNGFTGPIVSAPNSVLDPATNRGFIQVVMLGAR